MTAKVKRRRKILRPPSAYRPILVDNRPIGAYTLGGSFAPAPYGLPSQVEALGSVYRVFFHTHLYIARRKTGRILGSAHLHYRVLMIDPDHPAHEVRDSVAHEWVHAALAEGKRADRDLAKLSVEAEEAVCRVMARALVG